LSEADDYRISLWLSRRCAVNHICKNKHIDLQLFRLTEKAEIKAEKIIMLIACTKDILFYHIVKKTHKEE